MTTPKRSVERWTDDDVSALLDIYADDAIQALQLKAVSNAKMYECISQELADIGIIHGAKSCRDKIKKLKQDFKKIKDHNNKSGNGRKTSKWYDRLNALLGHRPSFRGTAETIDSSTAAWEDAMVGELSKHDDDELGNVVFPLELEISEISPPEIHGSASSSPVPTTNAKRTWDDRFLDTITAMDDRRALASTENEDRHAMANKKMHDERRNREIDRGRVMPEEGASLSRVRLRNLRLQACQGRTTSGRHGGALQRALSRVVGSLLGGERGPVLQPFMEEV
ncbi:uncharacterized protein LOC117498584 [Trematomus bernacchii]|uniref:uncharacterized protein LOC117498584 n=1 Tax=Trematomus bernacchii TaxID=40690 RepID=UPI00146EEFF5|nr:uncharacterized protein LOC117498584 [Trematomus bernacchii]